MDDHRRSLRLGIAAVLCAALMRYAAAGEPPAAGPKVHTAPSALQEETGRIVRLFYSPLGAYPVESSLPVFLPELPEYGEMELQVQNYTTLEPDYPALLASPLDWDLTDGLPAVLILSTHTTESYTKAGESYEETASWRTLDEEYNMLSIGDRVEQRLRDAGICVIRDRALHDYPSYNGSYADARVSLASLLLQYPSVRLVLDLHRDASDAAFGQLRTVARLGDQTLAQLMLVLGGGQDRWQENVSLGLKLMAQLERQVPGITRPLQLRRSHFNQDLHTGALLIEVGAAGNSRQEALLAADQLAEAIIALAKGTK